MRLEREENAHAQQETEVPNNNNNGEQQIESERQKRSNDEMLDKTLFDTMRQIVESGQQEEAFFLCDQEQLVENFKYWTDKLNNVTPYFDAGCNTSTMVLSTLAELGAKFSCANKLEMEQLSKIGIPAKDIIFGSSVKVASHLRYASSCGIDVMAFESLAEIQKIKKNSPNARLVYRLNFPTGSNQSFSIPHMSDLLTGATSAGLKVIGVSLNMTETGLVAYQKAISLARLIFALGKSLGHDLNLLDLGEMIPINNHDFVAFEELVVSVQSWLTSQFKSLENFDDLQILAHPSVFLVNSAFSLATKVIGKRVPRNGSNTSYVINDGIFGAFGRLLQDDDIRLQPKPLYDNLMPVGSDLLPKCDVYGPSGHDMDQICFSHTMSDLEIGDWLVFSNMGAFAMTQWENNYSIQDGTGFASQNGALLVAENFWFYSRGGLRDEAEVICNETDMKAGNASDDEEILCAFYQLPDIDLNQNDEEKFFTLLR